MRMSQNEYTYGQPANPVGTISMTKIKNLFKREAPDLVVEKFSNQRINGVLEGASGFVINPATKKIIYVSSAYGNNGELLVRSARSTKDYSGGMNNFTTLDELIDKARQLLA